MDPYEKCELRIYEPNTREEALNIIKKSKYGENFCNGEREFCDGEIGEVIRQINKDFKEEHFHMKTVKKHTKKNLEIKRINNLPKELISSIKDYVIDDKVLKNLLLLNIELKTVIPKNYSYTRAEDYNCLTCIEPTLQDEFDFSVLGKLQPYSIKEVQTGTHTHSVVYQGPGPTRPRYLSAARPADRPSPVRLSEQHRYSPGAGRTQIAACLSYCCNFHPKYCDKNITILTLPKFFFF